jgi:hypothetical protein
VNRGRKDAFAIGHEEVTGPSSGTHSGIAGWPTRPWDAG